MSNGIPPILYHYCSVETFCNIIISKTLWLTDSLSTNDYMENIWINKKIHEILPNYINDKNRQQFENIFKQYNINKHRPFIACFSEEGDILSQWRAYAEDGAGVSIGFKTEYFGIKYQLPFTMVAYNENSIGLHEVYYDRGIQEEIIKKILYDISITEQMDSAKVIEEALKLKRYSFVFKNPAFFEEREWRIIHTPLILGISKDGTIKTVGAISDCKYRDTTNGKSLYFLLSFSEQKNISPIATIILGPKNQMGIDEIQSFFRMNNFGEIPIMISEASYR